MNSLYQGAKLIINAMLPNSLSRKFEEPLRGVVALFYRGTQFSCNICGMGLRRFVVLPTGDQLCPRCGSLPRHRRLWDLVGNAIHLSGAVLHFSPSRPIWRKLKKLPTITYIPSEYEGAPEIPNNFDITDIPLADGSIDWILCYHVLEHIGDDFQAIRELYRVLKTQGKAIIQTPFKRGEIYEDKSIVDPAQRKQHFGQEDHVRIYSLPGLQERLEQAGFSVEVLQYDTKDKRSSYHAFHKNEYILMATKNEDLLMF